MPGWLSGQLDGGGQGQQSVSGRERDSRIRAATARRDQSRLSHLFALLLLLIACSTLTKNAVLIRENADARLVTTVKEGLFLTRVRIGDREAGPFLIDTGASALVLDSELAKVVPLSFRGEVYDPKVKQAVKLRTLASLEVGPLTFQNTDVVVLDLSATTPLLGERFAGLLGRPFFAHVVVEIDYPAGSIACFDPKTYRLPRGEWLPLTFQAGRPIVAARLEGNIEGRFMLDTGANITVLLSSEFVRTHAHLGTHHVRRRIQTSLGGTYEVLAAEIAWFELAGHRFEKPRVEIAPAGVGESALEADAGIGIIGSGFLKRFTVVLNYPEAKIAFLSK